LLPVVYEELRKLAAARMALESPERTLQATALVHEAYLRLVDQPLPTKIGIASGKPKVAWRPQPCQRPALQRSGSIPRYARRRKVP
jgi:hypothetical protein